MSKKTIQDVNTVLAYFGASTNASDEWVLSKVKTLDFRKPGGELLLGKLANACVATWLTEDSNDADMGCNAQILQEFFTGQSHDDGIWETRLKTLAATDSRAIEAIQCLLDTIIDTWENDGQ